MADAPQAESRGCHASGALDALPLVTLYLSERCNSRCATCDYWRHGVKDMTLADVERLSEILTAKAAPTDEE